jgi:hypothetical protein
MICIQTGFIQALLWPRRTRMKCCPPGSPGHLCYPLFQQRAIWVDDLLALADQQITDAAHDGTSTFGAIGDEPRAEA